MKAKERESLTPIALRKRAAEFAKETIDSQREVCNTVEASLV